MISILCAIFSEIRARKPRQFLVKLVSLGSLLAACSPGFGTGQPGLTGVYVSIRPAMTFDQNSPNPGNQASDEPAGLVDLERTLPLSFWPTSAGSDSMQGYIAAFPGGAIYLESSRAWLNFTHAEGTADATVSELESRQVQMAFLGANSSAQMIGRDRGEGFVSQFLGADPDGWETGVPVYGALQVVDLYPGIDLSYEGIAGLGLPEGYLKGTFTVAPGANPSLIRWWYPDAGAVTLTDAGGLRIEFDEDGDPVEGSSAIREQAPSAWQHVGEARVRVDVAYHVSPLGEITIQLGEYDESLPLVVDPTIEFATFLGGSNIDEALDVAVDGARSIIVVGSTVSIDFPTDLPPDEVLVASRNVFVTKLSRDGSRQEFSIFLGGSADDVAQAVAVDSGGDIYVTGQTFSDDFPTIFPPELPEDSGGDVFVVKLSLSGSSIRYSVLLGGGEDDMPQDIAVDTAGSAHVVGETVSTDFPTASPLQPFPGGGEIDAFLVKLAAVGNEVLYSTYLGGTGADSAEAVGLDRRGNVLITGYTDSIDFPTVQPLQEELAGFQDAFLVKVSDDGTAMLYGTYLGMGNASRGQAVVVDRDGNTYVAGTLDASDEEQGGTDAFVQRVNEDGTRIDYQTRLGGSSDDEAYGIGLDRQRNVYVVGTTESADLPSDASIGGVYQGGGDAFIAQLNQAGAIITYNYLGGSDYDAAFGVAVFGSGDAAIAGVTFSPDFPTLNPFQNANRGAGDAFVVQIGDVEVVPTQAPTDTPAPTEIPPTATPEPGSLEAIVQSDLFLYGLGGALGLLLILLGVELSRGGRRR